MTSEREGVRGLVGRWLAEADRAEANADRAERRGHSGEADAMRQAAQDARGYAAELEAALSQQPEARGVVRHDLCGCPNGRAEHSPSCAALSQQPDPKAEARGGVDVEAVEKVIGEMTDYLDQEVDPELDTIEKWRNALTEARNVR